MNKAISPFNIDQHRWHQRIALCGAGRSMAKAPRPTKEKLVKPVLCWELKEQCLWYLKILVETPRKYEELDRINWNVGCMMYPKKTLLTFSGGNLDIFPVLGQSFWSTSWNIHIMILLLAASAVSWSNIQSHPPEWDRLHGAATWGPTMLSWMGSGIFEPEIVQD